MPAPLPLVNQIIAAHGGGSSVAAGDFVTVDVDRVYIQDGNSPTIARLFREHGIRRVWDPERIGFFFDHSVIIPEKQIADRTREALAFAERLGARIFHRGAGISHVIAMEEGWYEPGNVVLGADSHTCTGGAVQSLALGMGASDIVAAMVTGKTWLRVPETVWLEVEGTAHEATRAKDVMLHLLGTMGQAPFLNKSIEWTGSWSHALSADAAATVASMGVELGAKCVFLPGGPGRPAQMRAIEPGESRLRFDIGGLTPRIARPHNPANTVGLDELAGEPVDYVFVGSCTNSRLDDIAEAAAVFVNRPVHPRVHCIVTPGSRKVYLDALRLGYVETLTRAGALVTPAGCGACVGTQGSIPADGERVVTTMNRNFQGRMGNREAEIFLASPLVAANVAVHGRFPAVEELVLP
ncbi:aconitase/3-isopropylmalate dehydratase large subunit family protein [Sorangium sp. So ce327]|uniref:3-isopropylmalate dehydratase large subunit n=1 Tax=Sorangium sp. So ce327 TaxID=3133301 RepID=UPI003F613954